MEHGQKLNLQTVQIDRCFGKGFIAFGTEDTDMFNTSGMGTEWCSSDAGTME